LWETFASHYIELVKNRTYNEKEFFTKSEQNSALFTLHYCLENTLKILAPITPFITHKIYNDLVGKDIHTEEFPHPLGVRLFDHFTKEELMDLNSAIWKAKKDKGLSLKTEIQEAVIPEKFKIIEKDLVATHSIKKIKYGYLEIKI
jgi:valyl-tRNA synthetase